MDPGSLLIADPSIIGDTNFHRSIILLVEHNFDGSFGFIINNPLNHTTNDLTVEMKYDFPLYYGGPVDQDNLFFMHKMGNLIPNSIRIQNDLYWGGDFKAIVSLVNNKKLKVNDIKFFLGYSGWSANQLISEIKSKNWIIKKNSNSSDIFTNKSESLWSKEMKKLGGDFLLWSNSPENPFEN